MSVVLTTQSVNMGLMSGPDPGTTLSLAPQGVKRIGDRSYLLVLQGGSSSMFPLPALGSVVVGRATDAELRIEDPAASRKHARFMVVDGVVQVMDLDSHNGTRVNGERLEQVRPLASGDVVAIGEVSLVLHTASPRPSRRGPLDAAALLARLDEEVERAVRYERPLAVVVLHLGARGDTSSVALAAAPALRLIDVLGLLPGGQLVMVLPELAEEAASEIARDVLARIATVAPGARAGLATCPVDGCEGATVLSVARAAVEAALDRAIARAVDATRTLELDGRKIVLSDPAMLRLYELVRRLAQSDLPVLVRGETGSGKENAAFGVHAFSRRAKGPFVTLNCAALPENLIESELFGHERGAFSGAVATKPGLFEAASGGTVFLDEIGELGASAQAKLLRAIEAKRITRLGDVKEREVDIRVVAATHRDLETEIRAGRFREDLFFRLGAAQVHLPPLRERPREIPLLARVFLEAAASSLGKETPVLSAATLERLGRHPWPGNVRELKNAMDFVGATIDEPVVEPWHLPERMQDEPEPTGVAAAASAQTADLPSVRPKAFRPIAEELRSLEQQRMQEALVATGGVQTKAADLIGMPLRTFVFKLKQYGMQKR